MTVIFTPLCGLPGQTEAWSRVISMTGGVTEFDVQVWVTANNENCKAIAESVGAHVIMVEPFAGGNERERTAYIAKLYNDNLPNLPQADTIVILEDDIIPDNYDWFKQMALTIKKHDADVAGVAGLYDAHGTPWIHIDRNLRFHYAYVLHNGRYVQITSLLLKSLIGDGNKEVELGAGGSGFCMFNAEALLGALPFEATGDRQWDFSLAESFKKAGKKLILDTEITARHQKANPDTL